MDEHEYDKAMDQLTRALERLKPLQELLRTTPLPDEVKNFVTEVNDAVDIVNKLIKQATPEQRERLSLPETLFAAKYGTTFSAN